MSSSNRTIGLAIHTLTAGFLLATAPFAAGEAARPVVLGVWTVTQDQHGELAATSPGAYTVRIEVTPDGQTVQVPSEASKLDIPGIGAVYAVIEAFPMPVQRPVTIDDYVVQKEFYTPQGQHWIVLRSQGRLEGGGGAPAEGRLGEGDLHEAVAKIEADLRAKAENDPAVMLLRQMLEKDVVLGARPQATREPTAEASIDGGPMTALKTVSRYDRAGEAWALPARPGQRVTFRFTYPCSRIDVTTRGLRTVDDASALRGAVVHARSYVTAKERGQGLDPPWKEGAFDEKGVALVDFGPIESARLIGMYCESPPPQGIRREIKLRWGRPEEARMDDSPEPMTPPASDRTADVVRTLLNRLEASYVPDRDEFVDGSETWGSATDRWGDPRVLEGLDLAEWPHVAAEQQEVSLRAWLIETFGLAPNALGNADLETVAASALDAAAKPYHGPRLWEDLSEGPLRGPAGWHHPRKVYGLAVLWDAYPSLRDRNVLERILDYWVKAIDRPADLVRSAGKASTTAEERALEYGFAAAALHLGHRALGKTEYVVARDAVLNRMRRLPVINPEPSYYEAMTRPGWRESGTGAAVDEMGNGGIYDFVIAYGQTCSFIGKASELAKAQAWIVWVTKWESAPEHRLAFSDWRPTFGERCGMIGVLRGRPSCLEAPKADSEFSGADGKQTDR